MKKLILSFLCFFAIIFLSPAQSTNGLLNGIIKHDAASATKAPAVVSINRLNPLTATTTLKTVTYRVTFSEKVTGVGYTDFLITTLSGTAKGVLAGNAVAAMGGGVIYDVTISSITGAGTLRLDLKSSGTGIQNNKKIAISGGFNTGQTYIIQEPAPTLTSVSIASNNANASLARPGNTITLKFVASTAISAPLVTIATHTVTAVAGTSNSFTASYVMASGDVEGKIPFTIKFSTLAGTAGALVTTTTNASGVVFDKTSPAVISSNRQLPLTAVTSASSVVFRITFTEKVAGVNPNAFALSIVSGTVTGTIASTAVAAVGTSGTTYDVTVSSVAGNGDIRLDVKPTGTGITDAAGNAIASGFTAGQVYTISDTPPVLNDVSISSNNLNKNIARPGNVITLNFTASQAVKLPVVTIASHAATVAIGTNNNFIASYTMTTADANGVVPFTIDFTNTLGTPGIQVSATTNGSAVVFDKNAPVVLSINRQSPLTALTNASTVLFRATFNEKVTGANTNSFTLTTVSGNVAGTVGAVAAAGTAGTTYDITVSSITGDGDIRLDLKPAGTGITDIAGNATAAAFTAGQLYSIVSSPPVLTSVSIASNNAVKSVAKTGDIVTLNFTSSQAVKLPVVTIATHAVTVTANANNNFSAAYKLTATDINGVIPFTIDFTNTLGTIGTRVTSSTNGSSVTFDRTAPLITAINRQNPLTESTRTVAVTYRVSFNEKVSGVNDTDFVVVTASGNASGILAAGAVKAVGTAGDLYDVTVSALSGTGSLQLDLKTAGHGIADVAGNVLTGGFSGGQTYTNVPGFESVTPLAPVDLSQPTKDKPQSKVWKYAGQWWCVLSATAGTKVYRLDGTTWTDILTLHAKGSKPDCRIVNDLVHVLLYKGALNNSLLYSLKYDPLTNTYVLWNLRPTSVNIIFPANSETATMLVDGSGRMWIASDGLTDMTVWWSDAPYTTFSAPITIATGAKDDDICALVDMAPQNKIGLFWSDQVTKRFGFKTHVNGADPALWSTDEQPASQFAIDTVGYGFADDHMNLKTASDGTVYCAAKTSYNAAGYQKLILLIRRPNGSWDKPYTVTMDLEGTQPIVLLNEAKRKIKIVYATLENGGDIVYRECSMDNIAISAPITLIANTGDIYDYTTSTHQNYTSEVVILATRLSSTPQQAVGVIASDDGALVLKNTLSKTSLNLSKTTVIENAEATVLNAYPNPMGASATISFKLPVSSNYELSLYNSSGLKQSVIKKGWAAAGAMNTVSFERGAAPAGFYMVKLQTGNGVQNIKVLINK